MIRAAIGLQYTPWRNTLSYYLGGVQNLALTYKPRFLLAKMYPHRVLAL